VAKILIVDDEISICEGFQDILSDEGHEVDAAKNVEDAIEKFKVGNYDLVFLDCIMPRMHGQQVFEAMSHIRQVPVIMMSGYLSSSTEQEFLAAGICACLPKPLDFDKVKEMIQAHALQK
jgi:DNA-binding NtrC family response regulator